MSRYVWLSLTLDKKYWNSLTFPDFPEGNIFPWFPWWWQPWNMDKILPSHPIWDKFLYNICLPLFCSIRPVTFLSLVIFDFHSGTHLRYTVKLHLHTIFCIPKPNSLTVREIQTDTQDCFSTFLTCMVKIDQGAMWRWFLHSLLT